MTNSLQGEHTNADHVVNAILVGLGLLQVNGCINHQGPIQYFGHLKYIIILKR